MKSMNVFQTMFAILALGGDLAPGVHGVLDIPVISTRDATNVTTLTPQFFPRHKSKRVQIRYGPYTTGSMNVNNGMDDFTEDNAQMPCSDCLITWMQAGLEYPNGTYANSNTSIWLHHVVLYNNARLDPICGWESQPQAFFASGNERSAIDICDNGTDRVGYYLGPSDSVFILSELMNESQDNQTTVVTITYEYIPSTPIEFEKVTPLWLDIGNCNGSDVPALNNASFVYSSQPWQSDLEGRIAFAGGHLHDGGINIEMRRNNKTVCNSIAAYGQSPGYVEGEGMNMNGMMMNSSIVEHISSMSSCDKGRINLGDEISVRAYYNMTAHSPMVDSDGTLAPVMGISIVYIAGIDP